MNVKLNVAPSLTKCFSDGARQELEQKVAELADRLAYAANNVRKATSITGEVNCEHVRKAATLVTVEEDRKTGTKLNFWIELGIFISGYITNFVCSVTLINGSLKYLLLGISLAMVLTFTLLKFINKKKYD